MNRWLIAILLAAGAAAPAMAQPAPPGPTVPRAEELATIPGVSAAQQAEIRRILVQRRNAQEEIHAKAREQFDALRTKERNERERADEQASEQLRKLLGEEGYRAYAEWSLAHRGAPGGPHGPHSHGEHPPTGTPMPPPAPGPGRAAPLDDE